MNNIILNTALLLIALTVPACATKINDEVATAKYLEAVSYTHLDVYKRQA